MNQKIISVDITGVENLEDILEHVYGVGRNI